MPMFLIKVSNIKEVSEWWWGILKLSFELFSFCNFDSYLHHKRCNEVIFTPVCEFGCKQDIKK